ncbi:MAG: dCTP deaminase [Sulfolobaceae archaeon]|nr:dCTP deaminase [Sulfolobaceae archaeon]
MILPHQKIKEFCESGIIINCAEESIRENGYDLRIDKLMVLQNGNVKELETSHDEYYSLNPNSFYLALSVEELNMPDDVAALMTLRSTFARLGFLISNTVIDAGYRGKITIALHSPPYNYMLKRGERFIHLIFFKLTEKTDKPYSGKYQGGKILPNL